MRAPLSPEADALRDDGTREVAADVASITLRAALHELAENFDIVAVPDRGKYVDDPATPEDGTAYDSA